MSSNQDDFGGTSFTFEQCETAAMQLRDVSGCLGDEPVPEISIILSALKLDIIMRSFDEMGDAAAWAKPDQDEIHIREDTYMDYVDNKPEGRFCAAHELGHICLHKGQVGQVRFFKKSYGNTRKTFLSDDSSVEETADRIARAFLMPKGMVESSRNAYELARRARVPLEVAVKRKKDLDERGHGKISAQLRDEIDMLKSSASGGLGSKSKKTLLSLEQRRKIAWEFASINNSDDHAEYRCIDNRWVIRWSRFQQHLAGGWWLDSQDGIVVWDNENSN